jgi:hypothetical protein
VCPGCGFEISVAVIDRMLELWEPERHRYMMSNRGCGMSLLMLLTLAGTIGTGVLLALR